MVEQFESFAAEKRPEVIADAQRAREAMRNFWRRETDVAAVKAELESREAMHTGDLLSRGYEMEVLRRTGAESKPEFLSDPSHFIFASQNETKRRMIAWVSEGQKMFLQEAMFLPTQEEEELEHRLLEQLIREQKSKQGPKTVRDYEPAFYALDVAEAKVEKMRETYKNRAIVGADVVVLRGSRVLEKPKDMEEAIEMLKSSAGRKVRVALGVVLLTPTNSGKIVLLKEGGYLDIKLRKFSEAEASGYLDKLGGACLGVVGGIDYASALTQSLLSDKPIEATPLQFGRGAGETPKSVLISPEVLPQLKDYFMGVPEELIDGILKRGKLLQEGHK